MRRPGPAGGASNRHGDSQPTEASGMSATGGEPVVQHRPAGRPGRWYGRQAGPDGVPNGTPGLLGRPLGPEPAGGSVPCVRSMATWSRRPGRPVGDPVGHYMPRTPPRAGCPRVETGGHEVASSSGAGPAGGDVGGERLRTAENIRMPVSDRDGTRCMATSTNGASRSDVQGRRPRRRSPRARRRVPRPRLLASNSPDQEPVTLGSEVAVAVGVLDDRQVPVHAGHGLVIGWWCSAG